MMTIKKNILQLLRKQEQNQFQDKLIIFKIKMDEIDQRLSQGLCPKCETQLPKDESSDTIICSVCKLEIVKIKSNDV